MRLGLSTDSRGMNERDGIGTKLSLKILSRNPHDTFSLGRIIGGMCLPGDVIALTGELGAGKTCLTAGIARGLGVSEKYPVTSPSFTLINEYPGKIDLFHIDLYRLTGCGDLEELGYEEYFYGKGVTVVEWAEKIKESLPKGALFVKLRYIDEITREIRLEGTERIMVQLTELLEEEELEKWH